MTRSDHPPSAAVQAAIGFVLVFMVFVVSPVVDGGDGYLGVPTAHSLLYDGDLDLSEFSEAPWYDSHYSVTSVEGRTLNYFPWLSAVLTVPTVAVWDAISSTGAIENSLDYVDEGTFTRLQLISGSAVAAAAAVLMGMLTCRLFELVGAGRDTWSLPSDALRYELVLWTVIAGLGTSLWSVASRSAGQHATSVLLGTAAMLTLVTLLSRPVQVLRQRIWPEAVVLGSLLALAYWARPTNVVLSAVAVAVLGFRRRILVVPTVAGMAATHLAVLGLNRLLVGRVLPPYFEPGRVGMHPELTEALLANAASPGRGLLLVSPFLLGAALVALRSRRSLLGDDAAAYIGATGLGVLGVLVVVSAFKEKWWAGLSYGPRFMTEALVLIVPLALLGWFGPSTVRGAARTRTVAAGAVLCVLSVVFHAGGAAVPGVTCSNRVPGDLKPAEVWSWSPPLFLSGPAYVVDGREATLRSLCDV